MNISAINKFVQSACDESNDHGVRTNANEPGSGARSGLVRCVGLGRPVLHGRSGEVTGGAMAVAVYSSTMKAVTMPNMPSSRSAWVRMWQCQAHTPGSVSWYSTV